MAVSNDLSLRDVRLAKLARLREIGFDPFAVERFERTASAAELTGDGFSEGRVVRFPGRIHSYRLMGKTAFAHLSDGDARIQAYVRRDDLTPHEWKAFGLLDVGDHVGVEGELMTTKTGEPSIHVRHLTPLSKSLHAVPLGKEKEGEVFSGLHDPELRYRHRHLDLLANREVRDALINRAKIVSAVRRYFDSIGYLEVETPLLQIEAGGASARPFLTHYNAYDLDVKLRISLELYLKRLICGDLPKVYEIGRVFRNEGVSSRHNPEFTMLEFYEAYVDLETMMERVEGLFARVAEEVFGSPHVAGLDFSQPWRRVDLLDEIERLADIPRSALADLDQAKRYLGLNPVTNPANGKTIRPGEEGNLGGLIEKLLEVFVEPTLEEPTFVIGYPIETSPLAKRDPNRPGFTRRFEGYVRGREVCNAFSEINDPLDQRARFEQQLAEAARGDAEAHPMDEDFLYALESGMPPTGGCGIGLDRMAMLLTGAQAVREVLFFPMMRPAAPPELTNPAR
ncbi:MAG: lysine--tRNA ligase [Armatimonadota bacterium]